MFVVFLLEFLEHLRIPDLKIGSGAGNRHLVFNPGVFLEVLGNHDPTLTIQSNFVGIGEPAGPKPAIRPFVRGKGQKDIFFECFPFGYGSNFDFTVKAFGEN